MNQAGINQAGVSQDTPDSLSAGIDGELSNEQLRFLLRRLDHDGALRQAWARYHVARDSLRHELTPMAASGFAEQVMLAIEQESKPWVARGRRHRWLRWSAGGAIAASVAAAALMIAQPAGERESVIASATQQVDAAAPAAAIKQPTAPAVVPPWLSGNSAALLSQQASATLGAPFGTNQASVYPRRLSAYPAMHRYRTLDNNDGSYLLLLEPTQQRASGALPRTNIGTQ